MNKSLVLALALIPSYIWAQQNSGPVTVRRTDHTLVWPLDFSVVNFSTNKVRQEITNHFPLITNIAQTVVSAPFTNSGTITASNFVYTYPRWTDAVASGYSFGAGLSAPDDIKVYPGSAITGKAYGHGDDMNFSVQAWHDLATTNALFPDFYFEPHIHVSRNTNNAGTNVTFWMELHVAKVWGVFTNAIYRRTNTLTLTNLYQHGILSFGEITNNDLSGRSSVVFEAFVERVNGGAGDVGNTHSVFIHSADVHVPFKQLGSAGQKGD